MRMVPMGALLLALSAIATAMINHECPPSEDIYPCACKLYNRGPDVTCSDLQNAVELQNAIAGLKGYRIESLNVEKSYIGDMPGHLFEDTHIHFLTFSYTKITSLGDDKGPPFSGLEDYLEELTIIEGFSNFDEPLTKPLSLGHLKKLKVLILVDNVIPNLSNDWFKDGPSSIRYLHIVSCLVKEIGDKAFANLPNLHSLHFTRNSVIPPRSALPSEPAYLHSIDYSSNSIVELPKDFFVNLPVLEEVILGDNAIRTIDEETWRHKVPELNFVDLSYNPLECDSKIKWIFQVENRDVLFGECASPEELNGRLLWKLREEELE